MDVIIILSATLEALQKKADTMSAFCIIFGVDIAVYNLRSYIANWSSVNIPDNPTLLVHRGGWVALTVQLQVSASRTQKLLSSWGSKTY